MNTPPKEHIRVSHQKLRDFVRLAAETVGLPSEKADALAEMLAGNDLKGNFSHGTQQIAAYARLMRDGTLNNTPDVRMVRETPCSAVVDGDGGLGYFPSTRAMESAVEKAMQRGMAVTQSRNHGHFGAAGLYARMTLDKDLLSFVTSGHQLSLKPGDPIYNAAGGSPMAFSVPCGNEDPLVLDFGAMHDLYGGCRDEVARLAPSLVLRSIGLGDVCQAWGGLLSGLSIDPQTPRWTYPGANQGGLFVVFKIDLFCDPNAFKAEMDEYARRVRGLAPFPGLDACYLPGGVEAHRERMWRNEGVPVGAEHRTRLADLADELNILRPW